MTGTDHTFIPVAGHPDDDECAFRPDGTDATYCGRPRVEHETPEFLAAVDIEPEGVRLTEAERRDLAYTFHGTQWLSPERAEAVERIIAARLGGTTPRAEIPSGHPIPFLVHGDAPGEDWWVVDTRTGNRLIGSDDIARLPRYRISRASQ